MKPEDVPAAIYKWGGPWPHEIAKTEMEYDSDTGCVLLMWIGTPEHIAENQKLVPGVEYKFADEIRPADSVPVLSESTDEQANVPNPEAPPESSGGSDAQPQVPVS